MSREDACLIVAFGSLSVAAVATWAAICSIRRDRAEIRATAEDPGHGNRWFPHLARKLAVGRGLDVQGGR